MEKDYIKGRALQVALNINPEKTIKLYEDGGNFLRTSKLLHEHFTWHLYRKPYRQGKNKIKSKIKKTEQTIELYAYHFALIARDIKKSL